MGAVIEFPVRARVAANDSNPWLSSEPLPPEPEPKPKPEPATDYELPPGMRIVMERDSLSGIECPHVVFDDEKPKPRPGLFAACVAGWLLLFGLG